MNEHLTPSQQMKNTAPTYPGVDALFWLGVDRFLFHGYKAYAMMYPGKDIPPCWEAYRKGIRSARYGWDYQRSLKELKA